MKTLDVQALRDGIDDTLEQLKKQSDEIAKVKKSVDGITSLDDALKGKGGDAIRAFYEECHTPFLRFYETFIEEYQSALKKIKNALDSFEPKHDGFISQAFLEHELEQGLNAADRTTKYLVSKANSPKSAISPIYLNWMTAIFMNRIRKRKKKSAALSKSFMLLTGSRQTPSKPLKTTWRQCKDTSKGLKKCIQALKLRLQPIKKARF